MELPADTNANDPPGVVLDYQKPDLIAPRPLLSVPARIFHLMTAVILPVACFLMSARHYPLGPDFQRNQWNDYLGLIPTAGVGWSFYPFLLFSMYAALMMIFQPRKAIDWFHIRAGLFTGVILAYQYSFIQLACFFELNSRFAGLVIASLVPIAFVAGMLLISWVAGLLIWNRAWYRGRGRLVFWLVNAVLAAGICVSYPRARGFAGIFMIGPLVLAPGLTLITFVSLWILVIRHGVRIEKPAWLVLSWFVGWPMAFTAAWSKSYLEAVKAYAALPPQKSNCYIATAAARGHRQVVHSWGEGTSRANPQLAILKAGERAMAARFPRLHRKTRLVYDQLGPPLARRIRNPFIADLAYLTLKPIEWMTAVMLAMRKI